jgi:hypothetical protein
MSASTISFMDPYVYVQERYRQLKTFLLLDTFSRSRANCNYVSKVSDKIYISDLESAKVSDFKSILSFVQYNHTHDNPMVVAFSDCPFSNKLEEVPINLLDKIMEIKDVLHKSCVFIDSCDKLLLHCKRGMSRSSFVFLYYEMRDYYLDPCSEKQPILYELLMLLKKKRSCTMIGDMFLMILCMFEYLFIKR